MKIESVRKKIARSPEELARIQAIRDKFQRDKPGPEECDSLVPLGAYLEIQSLLRNLKVARENAGLTLADVAKQSGIDQAALSRLENGKQANPTVDTLFRYSAAVGKAIALVIVDGPENGKGKKSKRAKK